MNPTGPNDSPPSPENSVWPPPPGGMPASSLPYDLPYLDGYKRMSGRRKAVTTFVIVAAALAVARSFAEAMSASPAVVEFAGLAALVFLASGFLFLSWVYQAYNNLLSVNVGATKHTSGWAVAYFIIPILSLYRPVEIVGEIWSNSDPDPSVRYVRPPNWIALWWLTYILMGALSEGIQLTMDGGQSTVPIWLALAHALMAIVSAVLACTVVSRISRRMDARHDAFLALVNPNRYTPYQ